MKALIFLLSLALGPASAWAKQGDCSLARREYERMIAPIIQTCTKVQDCTDFGIQWSECGTPRFHSKDSLDEPGKAALRALRDTKRKECGWVEPPCPALPRGPVEEGLQPLCLRGSCSSTDEFFAANKNLLKLRLVEGQSGKPLSDIEVTVLAGHIIYCVTTPCPEGRKVQVLKTDGAGVLALPRSLLNGKISIRLNGTPNGQGKAGSLEELSLSSLITLSESPIRL